MSNLGCLDAWKCGIDVSVWVGSGERGVVGGSRKNFTGG